MTYTKPDVEMLHATPMWVAEVAARTAYDSFDKSEHKMINTYSTTGWTDSLDIESSEILTSLAWVHHHHSVLELINISYSIKGTSRGVLQEHARHRLQSLTVRSTRYTMSGVLNAYIAASVVYAEVSRPTALGYFNTLIKSLDMYIFNDDKMHEIETNAMYAKLEILGDYTDMLSKDGQKVLSRWRDLGENLFNELQKAKKKRNVGDKFKSIVTDNWKVDMVVNFNLRSLKNYFELRDSGAAYFQIRDLAQEMKKVTPKKYLKLIDKKYKDEK